MSSKYLGDFTLGQVPRFIFNTRGFDGAPITLAGSPTVAIYKDNNATESSVGVTLTVDFDGKTGMRLVGRGGHGRGKHDLRGGNGYQVHSRLGHGCRGFCREPRAVQLQHHQPLGPPPGRRGPQPSSWTRTASRTPTP
jgi:hypothetical protein